MPKPDVEAAVKKAEQGSRPIVNTFICRPPTGIDQIKFFDTAVGAIRDAYKGQLLDYELTSANDYLNEEINRAIQKASNTR